MSFINCISYQYQLLVYSSIYTSGISDLSFCFYKTSICFRNVILCSIFMPLPSFTSLTKHRENVLFSLKNKKPGYSVNGVYSGQHGCSALASLPTFLPFFFTLPFVFSSNRIINNSVYTIIL